MSTHLVWFKRDLRVYDHEPLRVASEKGKVLCLYIVEPEAWTQSDASARQWAFVKESLQALNTDLTGRGGQLFIRVGEAVQVLQSLSHTHRFDVIHSHQETGNFWSYARDQRVMQFCREQNIPWAEYTQNGVVRGLKNRNRWSRIWHQRMSRPLLPPPAKLESVAATAPPAFPSDKELGIDGVGCPDRQPGGRQAGEQILQSFLTQRARDYRFSISSPLKSYTDGSRLSAHLAWGTLSLKEVYQATVAQIGRLSVKQSTNALAQSLQSFESRLHWRCHFIQKLEDQPDLEQREMHPAFSGLRNPDPIRFEAWHTGCTGIPMVDACMRALTHWGWINFRMRAMLMAFASYHLWLDWRVTGAHLARMFTDYEPGIHWPQVQMQSGTTGINTNRIYNPVKQGYDQDPQGRFVRQWLPELNGVPDAFVHEPWKWPKAATVLGKHYPYPIVDHVKAAQHAKKRMQQAKQTPGFRAAAQQINHKHGSRKPPGSLQKDWLASR